MTNRKTNQGEDEAGEPAGGQDVQLAQELVERARAEGVSVGDTR